MLRTRKKDINLKPNRILDKRSSRGMLYENEELRLRTIHINDEVDKGHSNIKKLRKENEHLKREIWGLRDECEKLEGMLKNIYGAMDDNETEEDELSLESQDTPLELSDGFFWKYRNRRESEEMEFQGGDEDSIDSDEEDGGGEREEGESSANVLVTMETPIDQLGKVDLNLPPLNPIEPVIEFIDEDNDSNTSSPNFLSESSSLDSYIPPSEIFAAESPPPPIALPPIIEITLVTSPTNVPDTPPLDSAVPEINRANISPITEPQPPVEVISNTAKFSPEGMERRKSFAKKSQFGSLEFHSLSRSEPNLRSPDEPVPEEYLETIKLHVPNTKKYEPEWDSNILVGHIETGNGVSGKASYKMSDLRVEEVIDELEKELGSDRLNNVRSVRIMMGPKGPLTIFISFTDSLVLESLIGEKGVLELRNGDVRARLVSASRKCSIVRLYSIPQQIPDCDVIRVLNHFGQVVSPIERSYYKGVDICERLAHMYVCKKLPQTLNVGGCESPTKISNESSRNFGINGTPLPSPTTRNPPTIGFTLTSDPGIPTINEPCTSKSPPRIMRTTSAAPVLHSSGEKRHFVTKRQLSLATGSEVEHLLLRQGIRKLAKSNQSLSPATPPNEVSFYRSFSQSYDVRRRSSASRFHLTGVTLKDVADSSEFSTEEAINRPPRYIQQRQMSESEVKGTKPRKPLPWFSCLGNGCI